MATKRRAKKQTKSNSNASFRSSVYRELNTDIHVPSDSFWDYSRLLWGEKKIGKTSLCAHVPNTCFLFTEPGWRNLPIAPNLIESYQMYLGFLDQLEDDANSSKPKYSHVVVDVADKLYDYALRYACKEVLHIQHPGKEDDFGGSWAEVKKIFEDGVSRLLKMNKGITFIAHAKVKTFTKRDGTQFDRLSPDLSSQAFDVLNAECDCIFYYGYVGEERRMVIRGDDFIECGCGLDNKFITPKNKKQIKSISMGSSAEEAFKNLQLGYDNKITKIGDTPIVAQRKRKRRS